MRGERAVRIACDGDQVIGRHMYRQSRNHRVSVQADTERHCGQDSPRCHGVTRRKQQRPGIASNGTCLMTPRRRQRFVCRSNMSLAACKFWKRPLRLVQALIERSSGSVCLWTVRCMLHTSGSVARRKQHRPGIALNANTTHVPTAGSSAALTEPNHTPTRHPRAKGKIHLQMVTPHAA